MPFQFERGRQFVEVFIKHFHNAIVAAVERDFTNPNRAPCFNLNGRIRCNNFGSAYPSKTFPHAFEDSRPIVAPLILIIVADKAGRGIPVSMFDRAKKNFRVQSNLMLRSPKPDEIDSNTKRQSEPAIESCTKRNRHGRDFILSRRLHHFKRRPFVRPRPEKESRKRNPGKILILTSLHDFLKEIALRNFLDYVTRRFNVSSAELKSSRALNLRWNCRLTRSQIQLESRTFFRACHEDRSWSLSGTDTVDRLESRVVM